MIGSMGNSAARVACVVALSAVAWLGINVAFNYGGQISGLFWTGSQISLPAEVGEGHTYRVADPVGFDGQYYHLVAHDPVMLRGFSRYVDNPRLRWRRIGLPGLAALLSAGSDRCVDFVYVLLQVVFVFLGAFWLGRYAQRHGSSALWGLAFLAIPAVAVSLDRMTIDLPLAALAIGLVLCGETGAGRRRLLYVILCAAPLVRETGMVLLLGWCLYSALRRDWGAVGLGAACALPAIAWWTYVDARTAADSTPWLASIPFGGILRQTFETIGSARMPAATLWLRAAAVFEAIALAGIWLALLLPFYLAWRRRWGLIEVSAIVFAAFAAMLGLDIWNAAYATGRTMSPLLILLGLLALKERRIAFALPLLLVLPRIALQYEAQLRGALRAIL